jgi:hypothetical protein
MGKIVFYFIAGVLGLLAFSSVCEFFYYMFLAPDGLLSQQNGSAAGLYGFVAFFSSCFLALAFAIKYDCKI